MKLEVLPPAPWYAQGLKFTCTQCGNCCTGGPGFVWISDKEVTRLAEFLGLTPRQVLAKYCRKIGSRWSLKERRSSEGLYDCVFLTEQAESTPAPRQARPREPIPLRRRGCSVYPVRPLQCRTWPFWDTNLASRQNWEHSSLRCPGMGHGTRHFTQKQIESLRDAPDWPDHPPSSNTRRDG